MDTNNSHRLIWPSEVRPVSFWTAVFIGVCIANGISSTARSVFGVAASWVMVSDGVRMEDLFYAFAEMWQINVISHILNSIGIAVGAGIATWLAGAPGFRCAIWVGIVVLITTLIEFIVPYPHATPFIFKIASLVEPMLASIFGAYAYRALSR